MFGSTVGYLSIMYVLIAWTDAPLRSFKFEMASTSMSSVFGFELGLRDADVVAAAIFKSQGRDGTTREGQPGKDNVNTI